MTTEFEEIAHSGGQFTIKVQTVDGQRMYSLGYRGNRPNPLAAVGIYVLPQGIPIGTFIMGGIGTPFKPPQPEGTYVNFITSDKTGFFGHLCPECGGYWRSSGIAAWTTTCPYCGVRDYFHNFLTEGQRKYVSACCEEIEAALRSPSDGEFVVDMDAVADAAGKDIEKPQFYYADTSQQNRYYCQACNSFNDILGKYGYCASCGTHNGFQELSKEVELIRARIRSVKDYSACVRDLVAAFDSFARQFSRQFAKRIPMIPARQKEWDKKLFHQLQACRDTLQSAFGIDLFKGIDLDEQKFITRMFHRRHVYEHNGGEVDEKYITDTGDTSVKLKQALHETETSAFDTANSISKVARNLHDGFHQIFPPERKAIELRRGRNEAPD
jgi:hypothetical protein